MSLRADAIVWARPRVQNFSESFARRFVAVLTALDGQEFDKARFFSELVASGVVGEPSIPVDKTKEEVYAKRWDSYLAPIRPFGLGFTVEEKRTQSPNPARLIWRSSDIARDFVAGGLSHRQFMALQLARTQFPKITMPLKEPAKTQLIAGAAIQPLRLFVEVIDQLMAAGHAALLIEDEVHQLARCRTRSDVSFVVDEITRHRAGHATPDWTSNVPADLDILLNDLVATGYFARPLAAGARALVAVHERWNEARDLTASIAWVDVTTNLGIERYYERLMASPTDDERKILNRPPQVTQLEPDEAAVLGDQLTGRADIVAGLTLDSLVYVKGVARLLRVVEPADGASLQGGAWQATAKVVISAFVPN